MKVASMQGVLKRYGSYVALDYIDLDINQGEIVGLLGPNGAGKTTLIQTLTGMVPYDQGKVELFGRSGPPFPDETKEKLGLVTQEVTVFEELTARESLLFFAGVYGLRGEERKKRVAEALEFVGLGEQANKMPHHFSGGMKRRLNIACALTHRPRFLIMDEPTVGIDPQSRKAILESVQRLRDNGTTILYTTHYMEEIQEIASRVIIMDQGQVIKEGTVQELIQTLRHEEKVRFELADPGSVQTGKLEQIPGVQSVAADGNRITVTSAAGAGNFDRILSVVKEQSGVLGIQVDQPNLEDVFLTLTGRQLRDKGE